MANAKVCCSNCKRYVGREEVYLTLRIGRFCSRECLLQNQECRRAKTRSQPRTASTGSGDYQVAIRRRDGCCRVCGQGRDTHVHHIVFRSQGGDDDHANLILLCGSCHNTLAHGPQAKRYRELFKEYVRILGEERRKLTIREVSARPGR